VERAKEKRELFNKLDELWPAAYDIGDQYLFNFVLSDLCLRVNGRIRSWSPTTPTRPRSVPR